MILVICAIISEMVNISVMQKACRVLVGRHDFSSFRAAACQVVHILEIEVFHRNSHIINL